jgi:hypothetical protein
MMIMTGVKEDGMLILAMEIEKEVEKEMTVVKEIETTLL